MKDLFGVEVVEPVTLSGKKKRDMTPKGYSAPPGTGPNGESCKTCKFFHRIHYSKTYFKCGLMHKIWSHCYATDIRANSPACKNWSMPDPVQHESEYVGKYDPASRHQKLVPQARRR